MASVVADTWAGLPLADGSVDAVLCIFAPRNPSEFARILSPEGVVVVVLPLPDHLAQLRQAHNLLGIRAEKVTQLMSSMQDGFVNRDRVDIAFEVDLTAQQATDLVAMGPNAFHSAEAVPATRVRVAVSCLTMTKRTHSFSN